MIFGGRLFRNRITPLESMTYTAGNADTFHLVVIGPASLDFHASRFALAGSLKVAKRHGFSVISLTVAMTDRGRMHLLSDNHVPADGGRKRGNFLVRMRVPRFRASCLSAGDLSDSISISWTSPLVMD